MRHLPLVTTFSGIDFRDDKTVFKVAHANDVSPYGGGRVGYDGTAGVPGSAQSTMTRTMNSVGFDKVGSSGEFGGAGQGQPEDASGSVPITQW